MFRKRCATKPALRSGFGAVITIFEGQKMDNVSKVIDMYDISILVDGCEALGYASVFKADRTIRDLL